MMNIGQPKKHLFFINGPVPNEAQLEEASKIGGFCCWRNALMIADGEGCEEFDFVHGEVPPQYIDAARKQQNGQLLDQRPMIDDESEVDNGDGTKTTTTRWRPNTATA